MFKGWLTKLMRRAIALIFSRVEDPRVWNLVGKLSKYLFTPQELSGLMKQLRITGYHFLDHEPRRLLGAMLWVYGAISTNPKYTSHVREEAGARYLKIEQVLVYFNTVGEINAFQMQLVTEMLTNPLELREGGDQHTRREALTSVGLSL